MQIFFKNIINVEIYNEFYLYSIAFDSMLYADEYFFFYCSLYVDVL